MVSFSTSHLFYCLIKISIFRPNPLQYFLVPDIEVENGDDEGDDDVEAEEDIDESVRKKNFH